MTHCPDDTKLRPWYREPWPWLLIALPGSAVIAGFATLVIALQGDDGVVADQFRRDGLAIYRDERRDAAARDLRVQASIEHRLVDGEVTVVLAGPVTPRAARLQLLLSHATLARHDRMVILEGAGETYRAMLGALPAGHWHLELGPTDRRWRLRGDFRNHIGRLELGPMAGP